MLQFSKENGGLKLVNLRIKNAAHKIVWLFTHNEFTTYQKECIAPPKMFKVFMKCSLSPEDLAHHFQKLHEPNIFWTQAFSHWFRLTWKYVNREITNVENVRNQILWYNTHIRINNTVASNEKCVERGVIYVHDILIDNKKLMTYEEFVNKYGEILSWFEYITLISAIRKAWKMMLRNTTSIKGDKSVDKLIENIESTDKKIKFIYHIMLQLDECKELLHYYRLIFKQNNVSYEEYRTAFTMLHKVSDIPKYKDFQYRLLCNAIFCNNRLYYWGKVPIKIF